MVMEIWNEGIISRQMWTPSVCRYHIGMLNVRSQYLTVGLYYFTYKIEQDSMPRQSKTLPMVMHNSQYNKYSIRR